MSGIDWSKAPEGSQWCVAQGERWYKRDGNKLLLWDSLKCKWRASNISSIDKLYSRFDIIERPTDSTTMSESETAWIGAPSDATLSINHGWYKEMGGNLYYWKPTRREWVMSSCELSLFTETGCVVTPRPTAPKPYTRDEALQFLVERLDTWPTDIADAPLCPGWGWECGKDWLLYSEINAPYRYIFPDSWQVARPDFQPFVSMEDAATAEQPAPSGKGDPILGMVLADLTNRALEGKKKYGEPLKAHNGRNALWDAYQEALDLCMYLRQAIEESR